MTIRINAPRDDRLQRMIDDPEAYFTEARQRAREVAERDIARRRERERQATRQRWMRRLGMGKR